MADKTKRELRKFLAPEFVFGEGARFQIGNYAANLGATRVLLVTDPGIVEAGWVDDVTLSLSERGIESVIFSAVTPNPKDHEVMEGLLLYNQNYCDSVVAIGGGSPIDCAKGIAILANNSGEIKDYYGVDTISEPCPPMICVPTTSGSSADVSQFAIINDTKERVKKAIISKAIVPDISLIDPEVATSMPHYLTACTGIDALTHAIEAYVSNGSSPITDGYALSAMSRISKNILLAIGKPLDIGFREEMSLACLEAGLAFSNASLGAVHAMAHSLGGYLDLPHGECNALLLEHVVNYNFMAEPERYRKVAEALGCGLENGEIGAVQNELFAKISELRQSAGIEGALAVRGVGLNDLGRLAQSAELDPCLLTNPRPAKASDLRRILEQAM